MRKINDQILSVKIGFTNVFLIKILDGYLLVDTSYYKKYDQFLKELKLEKIDPKEISYLVLTHHHDDHAGFAKRLLVNSQARLIIHNNAIPFLKKGTHDNRGKHWNSWLQKMLNPFSKIMKHKYPGFKVQKEDIILQGDCSKNLLDFGIDGKIIYTPGHSSDSISIIFPDGNAIVGDVAMNLFNLGETKYKPFFIQNIDEIFESWKKLFGLGAKTIHPAHGNSFDIEELLRIYEKQEKEDIEYVKKSF